MIMMIVVIRMKHMIVRDETWETLHQMKRPGESFDQTINRLIVSHKEYVALLQEQVQVHDV